MENIESEIKQDESTEQAKNETEQQMKQSETNELTTDPNQNQNQMQQQQADEEPSITAETVQQQDQEQKVSEVSVPSNTEEQQIEIKNEQESENNQEPVLNQQQEGEEEKEKKEETEEANNQIEPSKIENLIQEQQSEPMIQTNNDEHPAETTPASNEESLTNVVQSPSSTAYTIALPPPPIPINERMDESRDSHAETAEESSAAEDDENENSAVAAVLAAVEQASAEKATTSTADLNSSSVTQVAKTVKKKQKNSTPNKSNSLNENSSPSAQKRRKKDPLAPKAPLNGYLVYFNEERADMRQKNPTMSFGELTKIIALKWRDLPAEEKQRFINEAELDKERYVKEMTDYKKSDSYKNYLKETSNAKMARNEEANLQFANAMKGEKSDLNYLNSANSQQGSFIQSLQHEVNVAGFDIPIFTEEFIQHSKNREHEMRQLRKEINELEQQNNVLHKHIENMKQSTSKIESDVEKYQNKNDKIHKNLDIFRQTILNCFGNLPLPNSQDYPSPSNIDDYIMNLYSIIQQNDNHAFKMHVKSTLSKINFNSLFEI